MEKTYTLRKLKADDIFAMLSIINKIGIGEVKALFASAEMRKMIAGVAKNNQNEEAIAAFGMQAILDIVSLVCTHLPDCKGEIYAFLADLSGMTVDEIASVEMNTFIGMIQDVIQNEEFKDFFQQLVGWFK